MKDFSVASNWFTGKTQVRTYQLEELLATKLRALYQRKKGRDLFDLWLELKQKKLNIPRIIQAFNHYMKQDDNEITRLMFEKNLAKKLQEPSFLDDIRQLLSPDLKQTHSNLLITENENFLLPEDGKKLMTEGWNLTNAAEEVKNKILIHI